MVNKIKEFIDEKIIEPVKDFIEYKIIIPFNHELFCIKQGIKWYKLYKSHKVNTYEAESIVVAAKEILEPMALEAMEIYDLDWDRFGAEEHKKILKQLNTDSITKELKQLLKDINYYIEEFIDKDFIAELYDKYRDFNTPEFIEKENEILDKKHKLEQSICKRIGILIPYISL